MRALPLNRDGSLSCSFHVASCLRRMHSDSPFQPDRLALHDSVLILKYKPPCKLLCALGTRVPPGSAEESAYDPVAGRGAVASQFAVGLVASFIGPNRSANHAADAVIEPNRFAPPPYRWAGVSREQQ